MKIFIAIKSAALRSLKSWKGVLIIWFSSLLLVSMLTIPMNGALKSGFGRSMITEKLADGINIEVFTDLGANLKSLVSFFTTGFLMTIFIGFLLNVFLTGGLFNSLKGSSGNYSAGEFFKAAAKNFWSYLVISFLITLIIMILAMVIIVLPVSIISQSESSPEGAAFRTGLILLSVFMLLVTILLLVADYARAWQVSKEDNAPFRALGFGFSQTFRTFLSSYPLMIIFLIGQFLYLWLVFRILPGMTPVTGREVFLLFLLSQFLFLIKIMLKTWRYGSVTSLMEQNSQVTAVSQDQQGSAFLQYQEHP